MRPEKWALMLPALLIPGVVATNNRRITKFHMQMLADKCYRSSYREEGIAFATPGVTMHGNIIQTF